MTIESGKQYIILRMYSGNLTIRVIQPFFELDFTLTYATLGYYEKQNGELVKDYYFIDTRYVRSLNEHCLKLGSGFYIVDSKQMALQSLYHLIKRKFCVGETRTPFLQNLSCNLDRERIQECYKTYLNQLKKINV